MTSQAEDIVDRANKGMLQYTHIFNAVRRILCCELPEYDEASDMSKNNPGTSESDYKPDTFFRGDHPFLFLNLPGEIRNNIYKKSWESALTGDCGNTGFDVDATGITRRHGRYGFIFPFLNKQIRQECLTLIYSQASLEITLDFDDDYFENDIDPLENILEELQMRPLLYKHIPTISVYLDFCKLRHHVEMISPVIAHRQQTFEIIERLANEIQSFSIERLVVKTHTCLLTAYQVDYLLEFRDLQQANLDKFDVLFEFPGLVYEFPDEAEQDEESQMWLQYLEEEYIVLLKRRNKHKASKKKSKLSAVRSNIGVFPLSG